MSGPVMLSCTTLLRPGPSRVGSLGANITLPRTVKTSSLIAGGIGGVAGLLLFAPFAALFGLNALIVGAAVGGFAGIGLTSWSPLRGESFSTWAMVLVKNRSGRVQLGEHVLDGKDVRAYIGLCPLPPTVKAGPVRVMRNAVVVTPEWMNDKGYLVPPE